MKLIQAITIALLLSSCMADLRTSIVKTEGESEVNKIKGKALLDKAIITQGMDKISNYKTYAFDAEDTWRGLLGKSSKLWPDAKTNIHFKYAINSFDGQVKMLDGKREGDKIGLQNWKYYEINKTGDTTFMRTHKKFGFGIPAIQYFAELSTRLQNAEIITYAGAETFLGNDYELVHCTWKSLEPTKEMDQYVLWINKNTNIIEFAQYTVRDAGKLFSGSIQYDDFKEVQGIKYPMEQTLFTFKMKKNKKKFLHQLKISNLKFDSFPYDDLVIDKKIGIGQDSKY